MSRARNHLWLAAGTACAALALVAIARLSTSALDAVSLRRIHWGYAALAVGCALGLVLVYATAWWSLVGALQRRRPAFVPTVRLFVLSWPGRYAPASLPYYGGRLLGGERLGLSRGAIAASLVYENIFVIATTGSISMILLLIGFRDRLHGGIWLLLASAAIAASLTVIHPAVMRWTVDRAASRIRRLSALQHYVLPGRAVVQIALAYSAGSIFAGLIFYCSLRAVAPNAHPPLLLALAAYNIAGIAGMLALAVPGGLGVREGVTIAIIGAVVSPPVALSAAVLARVLAVAADLALPACLLSLALVGRLARSRKGATPMPIPERHAA